MDFFVVCATVIPVLFLALIYQVELFSNPRHRTATTGDHVLAVTGIALLGLLAAATEGQALHVLSIGHASNAQRSAVSTGTWALTALTFLMPPFAQAYDAARKIDDPRKKGLMRLALLGGALIVGAVVLLLNPI